jgi:sporulation protein YhbH
MPYAARLAAPTVRRMPMSMKRVDRDLGRFRQIVRGKIKKDLRKYMSQGEMIGRQGKRFVSIPVPQIDIPQFRYGARQGGGVGQGDGDVGDPIAQGDGQSGQGQAGSEPGQHVLEVDVSLEELAAILGEELQLPNIQPKGKKNIVSEKDKYSGIRRTGPNSLRHFKRTYREALRRQIAAGDYDEGNPVVVPIRDDMRYRSWKETMLPESNAVIIYMMDVSGSMGTEQKELVRITAFWIETWLRSQYKEIDIRYIVHDAAAKEVDQETFYHIREGGGTKISSAYKLCNRLIDERYPADEWNIYPFHFSDGDNWGGGDTRECIELLKKELLPKVNLFCYGQVRSLYGSGRFAHDLEEYLGGDERIVISEIAERDDIYDTIKDFLGKGK